MIRRTHPNQDIYIVRTQLHNNEDSQGAGMSFLKTVQELRAEFQVPNELYVELLVLKMSKLIGLPIANQDGGAIGIPEQVVALVEATAYKEKQEVSLVIRRGRVGAKRKQQQCRLSCLAIRHQCGCDTLVQVCALCAVLIAGDNKIHIRRCSNIACRTDTRAKKLSREVTCNICLFHPCCVQKPHRYRWSQNSPASSF